MATMANRGMSMLPTVKCSSCGDQVEISMLGDHECRPSSRRQNSPPNPSIPRNYQNDRVQSSYFFSPAKMNAGPPPAGSPPQSRPSRGPPPAIDPSAANRPYARKDVYAANDSMGRRDNYTTNNPMIRRDNYDRNDSIGRRDDYTTSNQMGRRDDYNNTGAMGRRDDYNNNSMGRRDDYNSNPMSRRDDYNSNPIGRRDDYNNNGAMGRRDNYNANDSMGRRHNHGANDSMGQRDNYPTNDPMSRRPMDTRPSRQQRYPSQDLAPNLDSPFPAFPVSPAAPKTPDSGMFFSNSGLDKMRGPAPPAPGPGPSSKSNSNNLAPPPRQEQSRPPQSPGLPPEQLDLSSPNFFAGLKATLPPDAAPRSVSPISQKPSYKQTYESYGTKGTTKKQSPNRNGSPSRSRSDKPAGPNYPANTDGRSNGRVTEVALSGRERSPSEPAQRREPDRYPERSATANNLDNGYKYAPPSSSSRGAPRNEYRDSEGLPLPALTYGKTGKDDYSSGRSNSSSGSSSSRESEFTGGIETPPSEVSVPVNPKGGNPYGQSYNPYNPYASDDEPRRMQPNGWSPAVRPYAESLATDEYSEINIYRPNNNEISPPRYNAYNGRSDRSAAPTLGRSMTDASMPGARPRHSCRGCKEPIVGKSVKASDGRLTGRYHRPCFVCTTCKAPFTSAQVYVHNDKPYCEYHYHGLNESLCKSCDQGIEGQYRETELREKYHPRCLTCNTCRQVLSDEYFEVNRGVFCERHALSEVRRLAPMGFESSKSNQGGGNGGLAPPGGMSWKAERRKTRLGMM